MKTKLTIMALVAIATLTLASGSTAGATAGDDTKQSAKKQTVYTVKSGDTLSAIADTYDLTYVQLYNANESIAHPDMIDIGDKVRIPGQDEKLPTRFADLQQAPATPVTTATASAPATGSWQPAASISRGSSAGNTYAWGYCTWYVKNKRPDLPNRLGNGGQWSYSASALGYATGTTPRVGAVAEQAGHVAYVEAVRGNMVTVSEMNYAGGIGQVHTRTVPASTFFRYIY